MEIADPLTTEILFGLPKHDGCQGIKLDSREVDQERELYYNFKKWELNEYAACFTSFQNHSPIPCNQNFENVKRLHSATRTTKTTEKKLSKKQLYSLNDNNCDTCLSFLDKRLRSRRKSVTLCTDSATDFLTELISNFNESSNNPRNLMPCLDKVCDRKSLLQNIDLTSSDTE